MVRRSGAAELVTVSADGYPRATLLPVLWDGDTVIAHLARANDHWRDLVEPGPALLICTGPQGYITPSWYAAKAEHGRVVPTWNYTTVHLRGTVQVRDDVEWVRDVVTRLTVRHEADREAPWMVSDAPSAYIDAQLRGIVGVEFRVEGVEAKAKLSQNRSDADRVTIAAGLRAGTPSEVALAAEGLTS